WMCASAARLKATASGVAMACGASAEAPTAQNRNASESSAPRGTADEIMIPPEFVSVVEIWDSAGQDGPRHCESPAPRSADMVGRTKRKRAHLHGRNKKGGHGAAAPLPTLRNLRDDLT